MGPNMAATGIARLAATLIARFCCGCARVARPDHLGAARRHTADHAMRMRLAREAPSMHLPCAASTLPPQMLAQAGSAAEPETRKHPAQAARPPRPLAVGPRAAARRRAAWSFPSLIACFARFCCGRVGVARPDHPERRQHLAHAARSRGPLACAPPATPRRLRPGSACTCFFAPHGRRISQGRILGRPVPSKWGKWPYTPHARRGRSPPLERQLRGKPCTCPSACHARIT